MDRYFDQEIQTRILDVLGGATVLHLTEIAKRAKTTRITARKHLERMESDGLVEERKLGVMRVFAVKRPVSKGDVPDERK